MLKKIGLIALIVVAGAAVSQAEEKDVMKEIDAIRGALPKLAIPMVEVGQRFQNMYYAAEAGNWALAAYQSKHMNDAMNPVKVTRPQKYAVWQTFYKESFAPLNDAVKAMDFKRFDAEYRGMIKKCDACHEGMGYGYIKVRQLSKQAEPGIDYHVKSRAADCVTCWEK